MENASKALLIAGAILVCILLIGVGMLVYNSAQGTISEAVSQMSSQEKDMFNQQFEQYSGTRVNGSNVKALLQRVRNNNNQNVDTPDKQVKVTGDITTKAENGIETIAATDITKINTAANYSVTPDDTNKDGLIDSIEIKKISTSGTNPTT